MKPHRHISVIEIAAVLGAIALLIGILLPALAPHHHHGPGYRQLKDAAQIRSIHQAMVLWAQQHPGESSDEVSPAETPAMPPPQ